MNLLKWWFERKKRHFQNKESLFTSEINTPKNNKEHYLKADLEELQRQSDSVGEYLSSSEKSVWTSFWKTWNYSSLYSKIDEECKPGWRQIIDTVVFVFTAVFVIKFFWFGFYQVPTGSAEPNILVGDRICGIRYPYFFGNIKRGDLVIFHPPAFEFSRNPIQRFWQKYVGFGLNRLGLPLPSGPESWVKRVVGLPGDVVAGKIEEDGRAGIYVNGTRLNEPYVNPYPVIQVNRKSGMFSDLIPNLPILSALKVEERYRNMRYTYDPSRPYDNQPFYNFSEEEVPVDRFTGKPKIEFSEKGDPGKDRFFARKIPEGHLFVLGDNRHNSGGDSRVSPGSLPISLVIGRASFILFSLDSTEAFWLFDFLSNPMTFFTKKVRWNRIFRSLHPFQEIPKS